MVSKSNTKVMQSAHAKGSKELLHAKKKYLLWPLMLGTILCDLLSLCHLIPTHSQHLHRPYMLSMVKFRIFKNAL